MISKAYYVQCDMCGDPAPVACLMGVKEAREFAKQEGYSYIRNKDICPRCLNKDSDKRRI